MPDELVKVQCPTCRSGGKIKAEKLASLIKCPKCGTSQRFELVDSPPKLKSTTPTPAAALSPASSMPNESASIPNSMKSNVLADALLAIAAVVSVIVAISVFLPWVHMQALQSSHWETWTGKAMIGASVGIVAALAYCRSSGRLLKPAVIGCLVVSGWMAYHSSDLLMRWSGAVRPSTGNAISDAFAQGMLSKVSPGIGVYLSVTASAVLLTCLTIWLLRTGLVSRSKM